MDLRSDMDGQIQVQMYIPTSVAARGARIRICDFALHFGSVLVRRHDLARCDS